MQFEKWWKEALSAEVYEANAMVLATAGTDGFPSARKKLESEVTASKKVTMEFEDLKEAHYRLTKDYEHQRSKLFSQVSENQKLNAQVNDLENNLEESNFQRQQLQKKVSYLGELNNDLHELSEANKNLETRLKSIGELESRLNMVAEERDKLLGQQESQ
jgi:chromosome segregation ATPase